MCLLRRIYLVLVARHDESTAAAACTIPTYEYVYIVYVRVYQV